MKDRIRRVRRRRAMRQLDKKMEPVKEGTPPMNRAQRRAVATKVAKTREDRKAVARALKKKPEEES